MSIFRPVPADALRTEPWRNGGGSTTQIDASAPGDDWRWRLSIASIEQAGPFSPFPRTQRLFASLDAPIELRFATSTRTLLRLQVHAFDGADAPLSQLPDGPTRAFNLMLRDGAEGELLARPLNGIMWLPQRAGWRWYVHVLVGRAELRCADQRHTIDHGSHTWVDAKNSLRIEGGGELVLVHLAV